MRTDEICWQIRYGKRGGKNDSKVFGLNKGKGDIAIGKAEKGKVKGKVDFNILVVKKTYQVNYDINLGSRVVWIKDLSLAVASPKIGYLKAWEETRKLSSLHR